MMGWMPGYADLEGRGPVLGQKLVSVFPVAGQAGRTVHRGIVTLFDTTDGHVRAQIEAGAVTSIRTPSASGVATNALARPDATNLAILGSGEQAAGHLEVMTRVRAIDRVVVWSLHPENAADFVRREGAKHDVELVAAQSVEEAVAAADVVCTATSAVDPVLRYEWLKPGAHLNVIGSSLPSTSEVDVETVVRSSFFVDHRETIEEQGGEYRRALAEGAVSEGHIRAELGEVLSGRHPGRTSAEEVTLYKSVGIVAFDLAAAAAVYDAALEQGVGVSVDLQAD